MPTFGYPRFTTAAILLALLMVTAGCATVPSTRLVQDTRYRDAALDADAITVISWNIEKGAAERWSAIRRDATLRARLTRADLLLLQEACDASTASANNLAELLRGNGYGWSFAVSFESATLGCGRHVATGVLTASRAAPVAVTPLRSAHREFGITPKTALATTFALRGSTARLLAINAHLLNFEWLGTDDFAAQLDRIGRLIAVHDGPVILAGDLNTRNTQRLALVGQLARRYRLHPVFGQEPNGRTEALFGGGFALDHVFYRGLRVVSTGRIGNETARQLSDHDSLTATFAVNVTIAKH